MPRLKKSAAEAAKEAARMLFSVVVFYAGDYTGDANRYEVSAVNDVEARSKVADADRALLGRKVAYCEVHRIDDPAIINAASNPGDN